jgi:AhpD family alkylhydroperoxidase
MSKDYKALIADIGAYTAELRKAEPDIMAAFHQLARAASAEDALDKKTKELIAMAIGVTQRCDGCIGFHAKALVDLGTSREELTDALAMCVYMGGGPALMYAADALRAYDQFAGAA